MPPRGSAASRAADRHAPSLAMALLATTERIGAISTFHTTHHKPGHLVDGRHARCVQRRAVGLERGDGIQRRRGGTVRELFIDHDERYVMAAEFVDIVKKLWTEHEPIDVDGKYYRVTGRIKSPRPVQDPHPLLVSAGASPAGAEFAARFCDQLVTLANTEELVREVDRRLAALTESSKRAVGTCPFSMAIVRPNEGEAEEEYARLLQTLNVEATKEIAADVLGSIESSRSMYEKMGEGEATRAFGGAVGSAADRNPRTGRGEDHFAQAHHGDIQCADQLSSRGVRRSWSRSHRCCRICGKRESGRRRRSGTAIRTEPVGCGSGGWTKRLPSSSSPSSVLQSGGRF